jgi:hypothetical protein
MPRSVSHPQVKRVAQFRPWSPYLSLASIAIRISLPRPRLRTEGAM